MVENGRRFGELCLEFRPHDFRWALFHFIVVGTGCCLDFQRRMNCHKSEAIPAIFLQVIRVMDSKMKMLNFPGEGVADLSQLRFAEDRAPKLDDVISMLPRAVT